MVQKRSYYVKKYAKAIFKQRLHHALQQDRMAFINFMSSLKQGYKWMLSSFTEETDFNFLFKALPIWLTNANEVNQLLPLQKEIFDLVIIDEASQYDLASSMPLLQRAKRAIIVGDPKQLRHLSFLSEKRT